MLYASRPTCVIIRVGLASFPRSAATTTTTAASVKMSRKAKTTKGIDECFMFYADAYTTYVYSVSCVSLRWSLSPLAVVAAADAAKLCMCDVCWNEQFSLSVSRSLSLSVVGTFPVYVTHCVNSNITMSCSTHRMRTLLLQTFCTVAVAINRPPYYINIACMTTQVSKYT